MWSPSGRDCFQLGPKSRRLSILYRIGKAIQRRRPPVRRRRDHFESHDYDGSKIKQPLLARRKAGDPNPYVVGNEGVLRYLKVAESARLRV